MNLRPGMDVPREYLVFFHKVKSRFTQSHSLMVAAQNVARNIYGEFIIEAGHLLAFSPRSKLFRCLNAIVTKDDCGLTHHPEISAILKIYRWIHGCLEHFSAMENFPEVHQCSQRQMLKCCNRSQRMPVANLLYLTPANTTTAS